MDPDNTTAPMGGDDAVAPADDMSAPMDAPVADDMEAPMADTPEAPAEGEDAMAEEPAM